jgi:hypothetical protein
MPQCLLQLKAIYLSLLRVPVRGHRMLTVFPRLCLLRCQGLMARKVRTELRGQGVNACWRPRRFVFFRAPKPAHDNIPGNQRNPHIMITDLVETGIAVQGRDV